MMSWYDSHHLVNIQFTKKNTKRTKKENTSKQVHENSHFFIFKILHLKIFKQKKNKNTLK